MHRIPIKIISDYSTNYYNYNPVFSFDGKTVELYVTGDIIEPYEKMFPREKKQEEEELPVDFEQKEISK